MNIQLQLMCLLLVILAGNVMAAIILGEGSKIQPGDGSGSYILNNSITMSSVYVNSSHALLYGLGVGMDTWNMTSGGLYPDSDNITLPATDSDERLYFRDFIHNVSLILHNMTGSITNVTVSYTVNQPGNLSLILDNISGYCSYGIYHTNNTNLHSAPDGVPINLKVNLTDAPVGYCNLTLIDNGTGTRTYRLMSEPALRRFNIPAGVLAAIGLSLGLGAGIIIHYKKYT